MSPKTDVVRLSQLLGASVFEGSSRIGRVIDVRLDLEPGPHELSYVVGAVRCSAAQVGTTLGYGRAEQKGPWILALLMRRLHRRDRWIPWDRVVGLDLVLTGDSQPGSIRVRPD